MIASCFMRNHSRPHGVIGKFRDVKGIAETDVTSPFPFPSNSQALSDMNNGTHRRLD